MNLNKLSIAALYHILADDDLVNLLILDKKYVAQRITVNEIGEVRFYRFKWRWLAKMFGEFESFDFPSFCLRVMKIFATNRDDIDNKGKENRQKGMFADWINAAILENDYDLAVYLLFTYYYADYRNGHLRKKFQNTGNDEILNKDNYNRVEVITPEVIVENKEQHLSIATLGVALHRNDDNTITVLGFDNRLHKIPVRR